MLLLLIRMGLIACAIWRSLLRQYQTLLGWWHGQIRKLEATLLDSAQLFTHEYQELILHKPQHGPKVKIGLTQRELALNWVFTALYGVIGLAVVVATFWP